MARSNSSDFFAFPNFTSLLPAKESIYDLSANLDDMAIRSDTFNPLIDEYKPEDEILVAASSGNFQLVSSLLKNGSDPNRANSKGWTPVMYAAHFGHFSVLRVLVSNGGDVDRQEPEYGRTALMMAASNGHTRCVEILVTSGADLTIVDKDGKDAGQYASLNGHGNNHLMCKYLKNDRGKGKNKDFLVPPKSLSNSPSSRHTSSPNELWPPSIPSRNLTPSSRNTTPPAQEETSFLQNLLDDRSRLQSENQMLRNFIFEWNDVIKAALRQVEAIRAERHCHERRTSYNAFQGPINVAMNSKSQ